VQLWDLFAASRSRSPAAPALQLAGGASRSHDELLGAAERLAASLAARGLERGDRLALWLGNREEMVLAQLAALRLGVVALPLNLAYRRAELDHVMADATPRLLLTEREQLPVLGEVGEGVLHGVPTLLAEDLASLPAGSPPAAPLAGDDDLALLLYTSGTTGRSKGARITHNNLLATVSGLLAAWAWEPRDRLLLALPLFHTHGLVVGLFTALAAGATVRLRRRFDADATLEELVAGEATVFFGVPTMYVRLVDALHRRGATPLPGVRLFCSGSAPLASETFAAFRELTGHSILERYGMTETGMLLSNPYAGERLPGTVGTPLPGVSARVVDREGRDVAPGEPGELLVRGSNVSAGYWGAQHRAAESFAADGEGRRWFRTGDLARRDPATGHYTLLGRSRELILRGGFNVYPREVEETLVAFPGVREAAVVGRRDAEWGEVPVAFVVTDGGPLDEAALLAHCGRELARFKVPAAVRVVESLPRNALGKVQKHLLPGG
jgi:malonyl-CoA/methylmalonyl-CoA synthetase